MKKKPPADPLYRMIRARENHIRRLTATIAQIEHQAAEDVARLRAKVATHKIVLDALTRQRDEKG